MGYRVRFVNPAKNYQMIKDEIDAAYFDVMSHGDLIDRHHLRQFEENLAHFVGTVTPSGSTAAMMPCTCRCVRPGSDRVTR